MFEQQDERFSERVLGAEITYRKDLITKVEIGAEEIKMRDKRESSVKGVTLKFKANSVPSKEVGAHMKLSRDRC